MIKMKRQKAKWSAVLTSAAMLMINIPVSAEEQSQYINGVTQINGYTEFEQPTGDRKSGYGTAWLQRYPCI